MTSKTYFDEYTECEIFVEEMNRKEALEYVKDFIDAIEFADYTTDMSVYVEYKDGSFYHNLDGDIDGTFKKSNVKAIILDDGSEYYVYGKYTMSDIMIPEVA